MNLCGHMEAYMLRQCKAFFPLLLQAYNKGEDDGCGSPEGLDRRLQGRDKTSHSELAI